MTQELAKPDRTAQLAARAEDAFSRLSERHQRVVMHVVDRGLTIQRASRLEGYRTPVTTPVVHEVVGMLTELRRHNPIVDPSWVHEQYVDLFELCKQEGKLDVARNVLQDISRLHGLVDMKYDKMGNPLGHAPVIPALSINIGVPDATVVAVRTTNHNPHGGVHAPWDIARDGPVPPDWHGDVVEDVQP